MSSRSFATQIRKRLVAVAIAALIAGVGVTPASADAPTDVQLVAPTITANAGTNHGEIEITIVPADQTPVDQRYTITVTDAVTDPQNVTQLYQTTDATDTQASGPLTISGFPVEVNLTVVVTAQEWTTADSTTHYLPIDSNPANTYARGSSIYFQTPSWIDDTIGTFSKDQAYADGVQAISDSSITYSVSRGTLPDGIELDSSTGAITGTPITAGNYSFEITAATLPSNITTTFSGVVVAEWRGCEDYSNASYASNILLNSDGTPIGCDYETQPLDLRPQGWTDTFNQSFASGSIRFTPRLGWACDDCSIGGTGVSNWGQSNTQGIPIGFDLNFFGTNYSEIFVNSNGSVAFGHGSSQYSEPLNVILGGAAGIAPFAVDLANWDVDYADQTWGPGSDRHADFFYWGRTTYEGKQAFVVTWMNSQIFPADNRKDFNTFQVVIVDNGSGDADYIINYGSLQDLKQNAGYGCTDGPCLAAGFGSNNGSTTLYASLQDDSGYLYNGAITATAIDGGSNELSASSLNSDVPGQFIYHMVSGYVPEVATVPGLPTALAATNSADSVTATWGAPIRSGGAPLTGYVLRYRLASSTGAYTEVSTSDPTATITGLAAGSYSFQVAAVNEIGQGSFSRSLLVSVAGPVYADLTSYLEAVGYAESLVPSFFTTDSWAALLATLSPVMTRENTQADVDAQTVLVNAALTGLVLSSAPVLTVSYTDYNQAVAFANSLTASEFESTSWANLLQELAVDVSNAQDQATVDAQTARINDALNALTLAAAGQGLVMADLTLYNAAVSAASQLNELGYSTSTWAALQTALGVPITRDSLQADVDEQTLRINSAIAALVAVADLTAYNLALADAGQYVPDNVTAASWNNLQLALDVPIDLLTPQADVDSATAAINSAIDSLVFTANMTAYNAAVAASAGYNSANYTVDSWSALTAALAIPVDPLTDTQIYVDIATTNILSAISALTPLVALVTVTVNAGAHGTTSATGANAVAQGSDFTFTVTPDAGWQIDYVENAATNIGGGYIVAGVQADVAVTVYYTAVAAPTTHIVDVKRGAHGTTDRNDQNSVVEGEALTFTITPDAGWEILAVENATLVSSSTYIVSNVMGDVTVTITYAEVSAPTTHTVTIVQGNHGAATPNGAQTVNHGATLTFSVTTVGPWTIDSVENATRNQDGTYSVSNVTADLTVTVRYARDAETRSNFVAPTIGSVKISGQMVVGQALVSEVSDVTGFPVPKLTYLWYCGSKLIDTAQESTYVLTNAEKGCEISLTVVAESTNTLRTSFTAQATGTVAPLKVSTVYAWQFDSGAVTLLGKGLATLKIIAKSLTGKSDLRLQLVSSAAGKSGDKQVLALADQRARNIIAMLKSFGVAARYSVASRVSGKFNRVVMTSTWTK